MYVYLQAYERAATTTQPLVAFVTFYRGQTKAFETPPLAGDRRARSQIESRAAAFDLALEQAAAGRIQLPGHGARSHGQKAAFWQAPVMLVP